MSKITELLSSLADLNEKRDALIDVYDGRIEVLRTMLEKEMAKAGKDHAEFGDTKADLRSVKKADVFDWGVLQKYIKDNDAFDILQRRVAPAQLERRINAGEDIPGVEVKEVKTLFVTGRKAK